MKLCSEDLWESLVRKDETATFFQTPAWHKLAEDFEGTRITPLRFDLDGTVAVLPLQTRRRWWGDLLTAPFGTYSSLLRGPGFTPKHLDAITDALGHLNLNLTGSPYSEPFSAVRNGASGLTQRTQSHTHLVRLGAFNPEAWVAQWSRNHRRLLKTAHETGYRVRLAERADDIAAYFELYRQQTRRWGSAARRTYPAELFQEAFRRFRPTGSFKLWLAEGNDGIVGGRLCLYHNFHSVEWHAAAEIEAMRLGVNHLLVHAAVRDAAAAGFSVYDFNPNPGLEAVDHFKRGFATEIVLFEGMQIRSGLAHVFSRLRNALRTA